MEDNSEEDRKVVKMTSNQPLLYNLVTLDVEENGLFAGAIGVLRANEVFASVFVRTPVDGESVIVVGVFLHVLCALLQLLFLFVPKQKSFL